MRYYLDDPRMYRNDNEKPTPKGPFLVFAYEDYYPLGGWYDFRSAHSTLEAAKEAAVECLKEHGDIEADTYEPAQDWAHIVDLDTKKKLVSVSMVKGEPFWQPEDLEQVE